MSIETITLELEIPVGTLILNWGRDMFITQCDGDSVRIGACKLKERNLSSHGQFFRHLHSLWTAIFEVIVNYCCIMRMESISIPLSNFYWCSWRSLPFSLPPISFGLVCTPFLVVIIYLNDFIGGNQARRQVPNRARGPLLRGGVPWGHSGRANYQCDRAQDEVRVSAKSYGC